MNWFSGLGLGVLLSALAISCSEKNDPETAAPEEKESKASAELIVGVWESRERFDLVETQPVLEFRADKSFRMRSQVAEVKEGTWELEDESTFVMNYSGDEFRDARSIRFKLGELTTKTLKMQREGRERMTEMSRIGSWPTEDESRARVVK